jgi:hypothetical protein
MHARACAQARTHTHTHTHAHIAATVSCAASSSKNFPFSSSRLVCTYMHRAVGDRASIFISRSAFQNRGTVSRDTNHGHSETHASIIHVFTFLALHTSLWFSLKKKSSEIQRFTWSCSHRQPLLLRICATDTKMHIFCPWKCKQCVASTCQQSCCSKGSQTHRVAVTRTLSTGHNVPMHVRRVRYFARMLISSSTTPSKQLHGVAFSRSEAKNLTQTFPCPANIPFFSFGSHACMHPSAVPKLIRVPGCRGNSEARSS